MGIRYVMGIRRETSWESGETRHGKVSDVMGRLVTSWESGEVRHGKVSDVMGIRRSTSWESGEVRHGNQVRHGKVMGIRRGPIMTPKSREVKK